MAIYQRGKIWWMEFEFEGRRIQQSTGFRNKNAALRAEAVRKAELLERRAGITRRALPPKFEEFIRTFMDWSKQQHRPKTHELHLLNCDTLLRYFEGKWLDQITPGIVEDFKLARLRERRRNAKDGSTVAPATVNRALTTLKLLYNHARKCGFAILNPTDGVAFLRENGERMRVLSFEEEVAYLAVASQPLRDIGTVMLETGMRPEEVFRIEVANLDFRECTIFNPFGKTLAARRVVPMTEPVRHVLSSRSDGRYCFPMEGNPERHIGSVRKAHNAAIVRAGIEDHFVLYDLRHTYATRAVAAGVDLPTLSALLGHTKIQMTMRYVHPAEEQKKIATGKLEAFRTAGILQAIEKSRRVTTISTTVN
jgi:integrase